MLISQFENLKFIIITILQAVKKEKNIIIFNGPLVHSFYNTILTPYGSSCYFITKEEPFHALNVLKLSNTCIHAMFTIY
jgi:hypothetical protein